MTDQVQGYTFEYAYSNAIIQAFANIVQTPPPAYPIEYNSDVNLYIENLNSLTENTGTFNFAIGVNALEENTTGFTNFAIGPNALGGNTTGYQNLAIGANAALGNNTTGNNNLAIGYAALWDNTTGSYNIAIGNFALGSNQLGSNNIVIGYAGFYYPSGVNPYFNNNIWIGVSTADAYRYPLNNGSYGSNELFIAPNVGLIGGIDNNTNDNVTNKISPSTSSYVIIYGELATSFGGTAPTSITAGTSPYTLTPSSTTNQIVIISGGSVSSVELNGTTTGLTSGSFYCRAGDSLTITYSTAPTILQYNV